MNLWNYFLQNKDELIHKWIHYFPVYEQYFESYRNKSIVFFEIGVYKGGSLKMWRNFFGPKAKIVGIDIDSACKQYESPGIFVRIGDQSDHNFLATVIEEFGTPDIVLDDGSHQMKHTMDSFLFLYPVMSKNSVYMVEDLHTAYWEEYGGGLQNPQTFIEFTKDCIDRLNADHSRGMLTPDLITRSTFSISIFDSMVCFRKGDIWWKESTMSGDEYKPFIHNTNKILYNSLSEFNIKRLNSQVDDLNFCREKLQTTQQELQTTQQELQTTQQELQTTQQELQTTQQELQTTQQELQTTQQELQTTQQELQTTQQELQTTQQELQTTQQELQTTQQELEQKQKKVRYMERSKFWKLRNLWHKIKKTK